MKRRIKAIVPDLAIWVLLAGLIAPGASQADHDRGYWRDLTVIAQADWEQLSDEEKAMLQHYRREWRQLPPERREKIREGADRYKNLTPEQRERVKRARQQYREMPEEERDAVREKYRRSHGR